MSKVANFNLPQLASPLGMSPVEFCRDVRHQKTRVSGLSCGVVFAWYPTFSSFPVSVEHRLVTDRQTYRQTDRHRSYDYGIYRASVALRGKNYYSTSGGKDRTDSPSDTVPYKALPVYIFRFRVSDKDTRTNMLVLVSLFQTIKVRLLFTEFTDASMPSQTILAWVSTGFRRIMPTITTDKL